ncbi:aspartic peptidase domain-containing protein [Phyllosticta citriasiana]|uniref:aspartic peptidase domain-containing protein n=1 Tax=Phyllosticta citriasiana TaxID=595635 RepID=UPI0030FDD6C8
MPSLATLFAVSAGIATVAYAADALKPKVVGVSFERTKKQVSQRLSLAGRGTVQLDLRNDDRLRYNINVTVGTPPQKFQLQLDTGSSDTWLPDRFSDECVRTGCKHGVFEKALSSTFKEFPTTDTFGTEYVDGTKVRGVFFSDTLEMGDFHIENMTMGLATNITGTIETLEIDGGLMGIGYKSNEAIAIDNPSNAYPNVPTELLQQGHISSLAYSLWLNDDDAQFGNILFGGVDIAKYDGELVALPIVPSKPARIYKDFTVAFSGMTVTDKSGKNEYNKQNLTLPALLDSGSTVTFLPDDLALDVLQGVGAGLVENEWFVPCALGSQGASINFSFGGAGGPTIPILLEDLCLPFTDIEDKKIPLDDGEQFCRFGILPMGDRGDDGLAAIFGDTFLRSTYAVYDLNQNVIALAKANFNATDSIIEEITNSSIPGVMTTAEAIDAVATSPTVTIDFVQAFPTFEFAKAAAKQMSAAAPAVGQLPPRLSFQVVMSGFAVVIAGMLGGSLAVLW